MGSMFIERKKPVWKCTVLGVGAKMMIKGNNSQLNQIESYKKTWIYMYNVYLFKKKYIIIYVYINKFCVWWAF